MLWNDARSLRDHVANAQLQVTMATAAGQDSQPELVEMVNACVTRLSGLTGLSTFVVRKNLIRDVEALREHLANQRRLAGI